MTNTTPKPSILDAAPPSPASGQLTAWKIKQARAEADYTAELMSKANGDLTPTEKTFLLKNVTACLRDEELG